MTLLFFHQLFVSRWFCVRTPTTRSAFASRPSTKGSSSVSSPEEVRRPWEDSDLEIRQVLFCINNNLLEYLFSSDKFEFYYQLFFWSILLNIRFFIIINLTILKRIFFNRSFRSTAKTWPDTPSPKWTTSSRRLESTTLSWQSEIGTDHIFVSSSLIFVWKWRQIHSSVHLHVHICYIEFSYLCRIVSILAWWSPSLSV